MTITAQNILFLSANPIDTDRIALDREARGIQMELERSRFRDYFSFQTRWAAEPLDLLRELRKLKPTVVHFSGHNQKTGLFFQDASGKAQPVSARAIKDTFAAAGSSVKLVILSACYSDSHAEALLDTVDCIVGINGAVNDKTAMTFAIGFYGGLGESEAVGGAFMQGCANVSLSGLGNRDCFQLKVRAGINANQLFLTRR